MNNYTISVPYTYRNGMLSMREGEKKLNVTANNRDQAREAAEKRVGEFANVVEVHGTFIHESWKK